MNKEVPHLEPQELRSKQELQSQEQKVKTNAVASSSQQQATMDKPIVDQQTYNSSSKVKKSMYDRINYYSSHKNAGLFLSIYSFLEAIILPIPIDVMLGPMAMMRPNYAFRYAVYATVFSMLGGMVGYTVGMYFQDIAVAVFSFISGTDSTLETLHLNPTYQLIEKFLEQHGILSVVLVGFTPLPFKLFSIAFGFFHYNLWIFIFFSLISRFIRFLLVAYLFAFFGKKYRSLIESIMNKAGWGLLIICVIGLALYTYFK